jgi:hypothetical protein
MEDGGRGYNKGCGDVMATTTVTAVCTRGQPTCVLCPVRGAPRTFIFSGTENRLTRVAIVFIYAPLYNHSRSRLYSLVTLISFAPNDPVRSRLSDSLVNVTNAAVCGFMACGIHCDGSFRFDVEEPLLVVRNFSRRRPWLSLGTIGEFLRQDGNDRTLGTQQQTIPTATSMGEKQMRHQDAPMGSSFTSPNTLIAQSIRRTARIVQLDNVISFYLEGLAAVTYKLPSRNKTMTDHLLFADSSAAMIAGTGA